MSCPENQSVYLYHADEMSREQRSAFRDHLKSCVECEEALQELTKTMADLGNMYLEKPSASVRVRTILLNP